MAECDIPIMLSTEASNASNFSILYTPSIQLSNKAQYDIALTSAAIYYSWKNISASRGNNKLAYSIDGGTNWIVWTIPDGQYTIYQLNDSFSKKMKADTNFIDGDPPTYHIIIGINSGTGKVLITIDNALYCLDISSTQSSIYNLLGYASDVEIKGKNSFEGTSTPNVNTNITSLYIHCNLASGSYLNGNSTDIVYSFTPSVAPWYLIPIIPSTLIFTPLNSYSGRIDKINVRLTDQLGNEVNPEQEATYNFVIRKRDANNSDIISGVSSSFENILTKIIKMKPVV